MADLDGFKLINDTHGHAVGDEVLQCFADRVRSCIRTSSDWIARYGGEEFIVVLPEAELAAAASVAEKIRCECASKPMDTFTGRHRVTASFGVAAASLPPAGATRIDALMRRADDALFRSKDAGRNCVSIAEPDCR
jgi:two-component system cell cycle response regulator